MWQFKMSGVCVTIFTCVAAQAQNSHRGAQPPPPNPSGPQSAHAVNMKSAAVQKPSADRPATQPAPAAGATNRDSAAIEQVLRTYAEMFNKHDDAATAALWSPTGSHENHETGQRLEGREAIQAELSDLFKKSPGVQLSIHADRVRFILPDVAKVNGQAMMNSPGKDQSETEFSAIFTRRQGQWLLDTVEETDSGAPATASAALKDLEWLVGTWKDQSNDVRVDTTVRWARGGSFLIWAYTVQFKDDETPHEGTQVIAWDPRSRQIRSWTFESDGSFGEGTWSRSGDEWLARLTYTSSNGELATATQVIAKINYNQFKTQMVGLEIDGAPLPSLPPVTVVRIPTYELPTSDGR